MTFDVMAVRERFPAMRRTFEGQPVAWFDGPGGSQAPDSVIAAIAGVLEVGVSNLGGPFEASEFGGELVHGARAAMADFFGAPSPDQIAFGQSMTSLTLSVARSLSERWGPGDEVVLTRLDHDANVSPWLLAAARSGATVRWVDFDPESGCALDPVESVLSDRTVHLAITHASNAVGAIPDVATAVAAARAVGATTFVDAVHYSAHGVVDVADLDCDFLAASAYKFHGPHVGVLYLGDRVRDLQPERIRPAPSSSPGSWEPGTASFEALAGVTAAVDYLASMGWGGTRRGQLVTGIGRATRATDVLVERFMGALDDLAHVRLFGPPLGAPRTATFALEVDGHTPSEVQGSLADRGIYTWAGHYYALEPLRRLGRLDSGGLLRVGFLHYNTIEEVDRLIEVLEGLG